MPILILLLNIVHPTQADDAYIAPHTLKFPVFYGGRECQFLYSTTSDILRSLHAEYLEFRCDRYGAILSFNGLQIQPIVGQTPISADWQSFQISRFFTNVAECNITMDAWDKVLASLKVRNLSSGVYCTSPNGSMIYQFDYLVQQ